VFEALIVPDSERGQLKVIYDADDANLRMARMSADIVHELIKRAEGY